VVLKAWHEVDNAIDAWLAQKSHHHKLSIADDFTKQALHVVNRNYQQGTADRLSVFSEQAKVLDSQNRLNNSTTNGALAMVNLYKSLGGGWDKNMIVGHFLGSSKEAK